MNDGIELSGTLERVIYNDALSGFSVVSIKVNAHESIIARGILSDVFAGERLTLRGSWENHPKFGRQLVINDFSTQPPNSIDGIKKYLASGLIKGIGPKFAEKLVERFGNKTLEIIDQNPNLLAEVPGVGAKRVDTIIRAWAEQKEVAKVVVFLRGKDVSTSFAVKIYKTYGSQALAIMERNPYRLVDDIWGIGFKSADAIALKLGLARDSLARIKAGILFSISEAANSGGNLYVPLDKAKETTITLLELGELGLETAPLLRQALHELYADKKIILLSHEEQHFITLPQFYFSEISIAHKIKRSLATEGKLLGVDLDYIYTQVRLPDAHGLALNDDQQRGIMACFQGKVTIITGGPGTGKTTLIKKLLELLEASNLKFRLAAPTGRAAKRMFEGTGRNTETIHRLLEFGPGGTGFGRNEQNALQLDFLIVDEASMIDVFLMHSLLKAMPEQAHLILLGDVDQLPSVGAGNVLHDLIDSGVVCTVRLTQIFRQAQDSLIIVNAHRVNSGEFPTTSQPNSKRDFQFIKQEAPEELFGALREIYRNRLPALGIKAEDTVVLAPMNRGIAGNTRINQELQAILNPPKNGDKQIERFGQCYRMGDRVMQIKNNYDKFVFNGDIGTISEISDDDQKMVVLFGERGLDYDFSELNELTLAYAISIHKSQGSEFAAVIIPIFMQHFMLLQRNLLYTAITRAKRHCILIGQSKAIGMAIGNNKGTKRITFLQQFLTSSLEARYADTGQQKRIEYEGVNAG